MPSARQQLKEIQEQTRRFRYIIAEPHRTGSITDTDHTQEWVTHCDVGTHNQHEKVTITGEVQRSKSAAEENVAAFALLWLTNKGLI